MVHKREKGDGREMKERRERQRETERDERETERNRDKNDTELLCPWTRNSLVVGTGCPEWKLFRWTVFESYQHWSPWGFFHWWLARNQKPCLTPTGTWIFCPGNITSGRIPGLASITLASLAPYFRAISPSVSTAITVCWNQALEPKNMPW